MKCVITTIIVFALFWGIGFFSYVLIEENIKIASSLKSQVYNIDSSFEKTIKDDSSISNEEPLLETDLDNSVLETDTPSSSDSSQKDEPNLSSPNTSDIDSNKKSLDTKSLDTKSLDSPERPLGSFVNLSNNQEISGDVIVRFESDSSGIEFYAVRENTSAEIYLGKGLFYGDLWNFSLDTSSLPNGYYYIFPYISNNYGKYQGSKVYVRILNKNKIVSTEEIKKTITDRGNIIQNQEEELNRLEDQIRENITARTKELSDQVQDVVLDNNKEEVSKEFNSFSKNVSDNLSSSQISEEINEKIGKNADRISDILYDSPKDEKKAKDLEKEVVNFTEETVTKISELFDQKLKIKKEKEEILSKDSDNDGITDMEELRLGTDPFSADTDQDGFPDGQEIENASDPLTPSQAEGEVEYQSPKELKVSASESYKVEKVELIESVSTPDEPILKLKGKAPPFSFVTIYIYSLPIVVVTKADADGNWEYTLDKPLSDGRHTVYASVTNAKGDIEKVSKPFDFAKSEGKIINLFSPSENVTDSPVQDFKRSFIIMLAITVGLALVFVFLILGIYLKQDRCK